MGCAWKVIFLLLSINSLVNSLKLDCTFKSSNGSIYVCFPKQSFKVVEKSDRKVTEVTGLQQDEKTSVDVVKIQSRGNTIKFLPQNLQIFFPNLESIDISHAKLQKISKNDFIPFGTRLKSVKLPFNKIKFLESGLFQHNPNLELINLSNNQISFVSRGALSNVKEHVTTFSFFNNPCFNGGSYYPKKSMIGIHKLFLEIETVCSGENHDVQNNFEKEKNVKLFGVFKEAGRDEV